MKFKLNKDVSFPPTLKDLVTGEEHILTTDIEIFLSRAVLDLEARIEVLEKRLSHYMEKTYEKK